MLGMIKFGVGCSGRVAGRVGDGAGWISPAFFGNVGLGGG
jgi:hypothetical protein